LTQVPIENEVFLQRLCELSLEEGCAYIRDHAWQIPDHDALATLIRRASLGQRNINVSLSLKLAELLTFLGEHLQHKPAYALGLLTKGDGFSHIGHHQKALEYLDTAGEVFLHLGDLVNWAHTRMCWIIASAWLGHAEEALQEANRAREMFRQRGEQYWVCVLDHNVAVIYKRLGQYQDAIKLYDNVLATYPSVSVPSSTLLKQSIAMAQANQALNLSLLGRFEAAYRLLQEAQNCFRELRQPGAVAKIDMHLAEIDYVQGYYGSALERYYQARDTLIENAVDDQMILAELQLRMSDCFLKLNKAAEACQLALQAVTTYRQHGVSLDTGEALRQYAKTLVAMERSEEALSVLSEAWTLFHQGGFDPYASDTILQQAELLLDTHSSAQAYTQACLVKQFFDTHSLVAQAIRARLTMASALLASLQQSEGDAEQRSHFFQEAQLLCSETLSRAWQHNLQEQVYKSHYLLGQLAALQGNAHKAIQHYQATIVQIEHMLEDLAYDLSPAFLHTTANVYGDIIVLYLQQGKFERAFSYLERARSTALHQYLNSKSAEQSQRTASGNVSSVSQGNSIAVLQMYDKLRFWQETYRKYSAQLASLDASVSSAVSRDILQAELKRCEVQLNELFERMHLTSSNTCLSSHESRGASRKVKGIDAAYLRQCLSPGQLLMAYFLYQGRLILFALTQERLIVHEDAQGEEQLERLLLLLHAHLLPEGWPNPGQPQPQQQQTIRRLLHKLYDLLIAPVAPLLPPALGHLTIVPYAALHKLPFHALYDGSQFLVERFQIHYLPASHLLPRLQSGPLKHTATKPPLVFGYSRKGHLQRAIDEARSVSTLLGGHCYLEEEASIARLTEEAPGSSIVHLATHGESRLDAPNFSSISLADGQLTALDAFHLNLEGCELVTLSGCETGLSFTSGGDEQLGLGRAFLAAGVPSLVISLWPVEDNATNELMQRFYQHLLRGESKIEALRIAQCSLLQSVTYTHPYFWAAFRLVGNLDPLHFSVTPTSFLNS